MSFKRGDFVYVTVENGPTVKAMVVLASANGRSLAICYDGALPVGGGFALGFLPILYLDARRVYNGDLSSLERLIEAICSPLLPPHA